MRRFSMWGDHNGTIEIQLRDLEIEHASTAMELWSGEESTIDSSLTVSLNAHGAKAYQIR